MADMWIRPLKQTDTPLISEWITQTKNNLVDMDVLRYPETITLAASKDGPVAYLPVQAVAMMESLASKPGASKLEVAEALALFVKVLSFQCMQKNLHELYFLTHDADTAKFAKQHGFTDMTCAAETCPHCHKPLPFPHTITMRLKFDKTVK